MTATFGSEFRSLACAGSKRILPILTRRVCVPIYEFYCADCHTVYSSLSKKIDIETRPKCPRCKHPSLSAVYRGSLFP